MQDDKVCKMIMKTLEIFNQNNEAREITVDYTLSWGSREHYPVVITVYFENQKFEIKTKLVGAYKYDEIKTLETQLEQEEMLHDYFFTTDLEEQILELIEE